MRHWLVTFLLMHCIMANAQLTFSINDIFISNLRSIDKEGLMNESHEDGPLIEVNCIFCNTNDSTITLYPSKSDITILFNYNRRSYEVRAFPLAFLEKDTIKILPGQTEESSFASNLLISTGILNNNKKDYLLDMIKILPTLKIRYKDKNFNVTTSEILNVEIR